MKMKNGGGSIHAPHPATALFRVTSRSGQAGFTLIELMIAMAVAGVMMTLIYLIHDAQSRMYVTQRQMAHMQQNVRAAMYYMGRNIRMAGFDRQGTSGAGVITADPGLFAFTVDDNQDGVIQAASDFENIAFRLSGDRLEQSSTGAVSWQPIAENIDALAFEYLDNDGNVAATLAEIRSVRVTLTANSGDMAREATRQMTLSAEFKCRNLGMR